MDETTDHAKLGLSAQIFVYYKLKELLPDTKIFDSRSFLQKEMGVTNERDLNYFEKVNGDLWITLNGHLIRIEVCAGMPGNRAVSVGESKISSYVGEYYCFITHFPDGGFKDVCWVKRLAVLNYLEKADWQGSKNGGESYKMFFPQTFRNGLHSFSDFVGQISQGVI